MAIRLVLDPKKVNDSASFDNPGVTQLDDDTYQVAIVVMAFSYTTLELKVPDGKEIICSSFFVEKGNVVIPIMKPRTCILFEFCKLHFLLKNTFMVSTPYPTNKKVVIFYLI